MYGEARQVKALKEKSPFIGTVLVIEILKNSF
jgi:hypothetical protein